MECPRWTQPVCITYSSISVYFQFLNIEMVVLKVLREFAGSTSIHGFTFLVSPKSSSRTKFIWTISIVVALSYASWEMRNSVIGKYILKTLLCTTILLSGSFLLPKLCRCSHTTL